MKNDICTLFRIVQLSIIVCFVSLVKLFLNNKRLKTETTILNKILVSGDNTLFGRDYNDTGIYLQERLIGNASFLCYGRNCDDILTENATINKTEIYNSILTKEMVHELARGIRLIALYEKGKKMYIFSTLVGDMPERVILCSFDYDLAIKNRRILPGPVIFSSMHDGQLSGLYFIPDPNEGRLELKGTILYTHGNEQVLGAVKLKVNLTEYETSVQYRNHSLIDKEVFQESSLASQKNAPKRPLLITGVGRSGTTFVCTYMNQFGWKISHDNSKDCGKFPGDLGASSWYHAFHYEPFIKRKRNEVGPLIAEKVVHLIRQPLAVTKSRIARFHRTLEHYSLYKNHENVSFAYEDIINNNTLLSSFALRHWINRNSFVSKHAQWRVKIEDLTKDPLQTWMLCLEVMNTDCPTLSEIQEKLLIQNTNINHKGRVKNYYEDNLVWWERLAKINLDDVRIALKMRQEYGYSNPNYLEDRFQVSTIKYTCGFLSVETGINKVWGCSLQPYMH